MDGRIASESCPDFEVVSCFVDGEIDDGKAAWVQRHVAECERCAGLCAKLCEGFRASIAGRDGGIGGSGCADEERMVLFATGGLAEDERAAVESHLTRCDACVYGLSLLQRRLRVDASVDRPVSQGIFVLKKRRQSPRL